MGRSGSEHENEAPRRRPRWIFQVESNADRAVIRVLDTLNDTIFREIPIEEFLEYARNHRDVTAFLLEKLKTMSEDPA
ncbi:MAG: flagellar protein FlaG [Planctomycetota bacterium]|jgi:uncharacterized FlaG/YvyC family protein